MKHIERARRLLAKMKEQAELNRATGAGVSMDCGDASPYWEAAEDQEFLAELLQEYIDKWEVTNANRC